MDEIILEIEEDQYDLAVEDDTGQTIDADLTLVVQHVDYVLPPATRGTLGGVIVGEDLQVTPEGVLSVDKATQVEEDNTKPITAAAVYTEVGNINALLATI